MILSWGSAHVRPSTLQIVLETAIGLPIIQFIMAEMSGVRKYGLKPTTFHIRV